MKLDLKIKEIRQIICQERREELCTTISAALNYATLGKLTNNNSVRAINKVMTKTSMKTREELHQEIVRYTEASFRLSVS